MAVMMKRMMREEVTGARDLSSALKSTRSDDSFRNSRTVVKTVVKIVVQTVSDTVARIEACGKTRCAVVKSVARTLLGCIVMIVACQEPHCFREGLQNG